MKSRIWNPKFCTALPPATDATVFLILLFEKTPSSVYFGSGVFFVFSFFRERIGSALPEAFSVLISYFVVRMRMVRISYGLIVSEISFSFTSMALSTGCSSRLVSSAERIASAQYSVTFVLAFSTSYRRTMMPSPSSAFYTVSSTTLRLSTDRNSIRSFSAALETAFAGTFRFSASCTVPASRHVPACGYRE